MMGRSTQLSRSIMAVTLLTFITCTLVAVNAAVIGIDFGSEFIKVALVKPGTPFHIVIDEQSMRKIPHCIGFDEDQRVFGNGATSLMVRKPKHTYMFAHTLLGRSIDSPQAKLFQEYNYPYELVAVPERNTVAFVHPDGETYTPEELVAMSFQHIKAICQADAEMPVTDAVVTVPEFWTQKERQALFDAAEIAGINILSLVNENTAAAIQYGIDRKFVANETHRVIFYNMGSTSTKVTVAEFTGYPERGKKNKTVGQLEVLSVAYDETLGGQAFEVRLMDWMIEEANRVLATKAKKGGITDVRTNGRAMAKLRNAAIKAKAILSANKETPVFVSSLANDIDFKSFITRDKFIELTADLIGRAVAPLQRVLEDTKLESKDIDAILIIGGGVRMPAIQRALKDFLKRDDLGLGLDGDESMAMGAVFRAANLSTQFQVRKFGMIDVTPFPVGVRLANLPKDGVVEAPVEDESVAAEVATDDNEDDKEGDETAAGTAAVVEEDKKVEVATKAFSKRATLFRRYNRLAKKKTVAFSHTHDLVCSMHHDSPKLLPPGVSAAIASYNITGVETLYRDDANKRLTETQKPKVALSFQLDASGMVDLVKAEATLEEMVKVPLPKKVNKTEAAAKAAAEKANDTTDTDAKTDTDAPAATDDTTADKKADTDATDGVKSDDTTATATASEVEEPQFTMRKKIHRFNLAVTRGPPVSADASRPCTSDAIKASRSKLAKLNRADEIQREIAQSKNDVESHIYNTRQSLEKDEWLAVSTEAQRETVSTALETAESWLYEQSDESAKPFKDKIAELKALSDPIAFRVMEVIDRADALNQSLTLIKYTRDMLKRFETERPWLPKADVDELKAIVEEVESWTEKKQAEQAAKAPSDVPAYTSSEMFDKLRPIARTSSALLKRKKPIETPKPKAKKNATATASPNGTDGADANDTDSAADNTDATDTEETTQTGADTNADETPTKAGKPKDDL